MTRRLAPALAAAAACLAVLALGCARAPSPAPPGPDARTLWQTFARASDTAGPPAFSLQASLNYSGPGQSHRVLIDFWGNLDTPLRLDVRAGVGATIAMLREDARGLQTYLPDKGEAWMHADPGRGMAAWGPELPFSLRELALLLNGRHAGLVPEDYSTARLVPGRGFEYQFGSGRLAGTMLLDKDARPLQWTQAGQTPWTVAFEEYGGDDRPDLARRYRITREDGRKALLRIKQYRELAAPWPGQALELAMPPGTLVRRLQ